MRSRAGRMTLLLAELLALSAGGWGLVRGGEAATPRDGATAKPSAPAQAQASTAAGSLPDSEGAFAPSSQQYDYASGLLARKLYVESEQEFTVFLQTYPDDSRVPLARFRRGEARFAQGRYRGAAPDYYETVVSGQPAEVQALARVRYGCCLFELQQYADAVTTLRPVAALPAVSDAKPAVSGASAGKASDSVDAELSRTARYYLGRSLQRLGKLDEADKALAAVDGAEFGALALFARADLAGAAGKFADSAKLFHDFAAAYPKHRMFASARLREAEALRQAGKLPEASALFTALMEQEDPGLSAQAKYGLAWIHYREGKYDAAAGLAREVSKGTPGQDAELTSDAAYLAGLSLQGLKQYQDAYAQFEVVRAGAYVEKAQLQKAWAAYLSGQDELALVALGALGDGAKLDAEGMYLKGKSLMRLKRFDEAIRQLGMLVEAKGAPHVDAALYDLGYCQEQLAKFEDAAATYERFVAEYPRHERMLDALLGRGRALVELEKYEAALQVYARILAVENVRADMREYALNQQAICYYWLKQFANMNRTYQQLLADFPKAKTAPDALYWMAWHASDEKRFAQAVELYTRLLREYPDHSLSGYARYRRAMSLYSDNRPREAAEDLYQLLEQKAPVTLELQELLWLGAELMEEGRLEESERVYAAVLSRETDPAVQALARFQQAEARRSRQKWAEALELYQELKGNADAGVKMASRFGAAVCLRRLERGDEARQLLETVEVSSDDPLAAHVLYEMGMLDMEQERFASAAERLMRVGLLYDDEKLAGESLLAASEACKKLGDLRKAYICLRELAGQTPESYGQRYPKNSFTEEGKKRLAAMDAKAVPGAAP